MTPSLFDIVIAIAVMAVVRILGFLLTPGEQPELRPDSRVARETRISELEHSLELLPCSSDKCWKCHPELDPEYGTLTMFGDKQFVWMGGTWHRVVS